MGVTDRCIDDPVFRLEGGDFSRIRRIADVDHEEPRIIGGKVGVGSGDHEFLSQSSVS